MKALLRCGFVGLILVGLASQALRVQRENGEGDPVSLLAGRLERLDVRTDGAAASGVVTGHAAACDQPIQVRLLRIDGAEDSGLQDIDPAGVLVRYVFLGCVADHPDRAGLIARWVWATGRFAVGLRSGKPPSRLVQVALPVACPGLAAMDWSVLSPWE